MTSLLLSLTMTGLFDGQVHLVQRRDVVFCRRVVSIEPERVGLQVEQLEIGTSELSVGAGIVDVPRELLARDLDDQRLAR